MLGGGETHIRALGGRAGGLRHSGDGGDAARRRGAGRPPRRSDGMRVLRVPPSGAGRAGKYAHGPAAPSGPLPGARALRRRSSCGARACSACPASSAGALARQSGRAPARGQRRDDGRGLHVGHRLDRRLRAAGWCGRPCRVRNLLLRDADAFVAMSRRDPPRSSWPRGRAGRKDAPLIPHGVDTERFRPASAEERATLRARGSALPAEALIVDLHGPAAARQGPGDPARGLSEVARDRSRARSSADRGLGRRAGAVGRGRAPERVARERPGSGA